MQAIRTVMEQIEKKHRKFLLVMATGTGKTRTAIALVEALMKAGWLKRVLFLVDRIALRNQAREAFQEHTPNLSTWPNEGEKEFVTNRRVYISTYPSMLNVIENKSNTLSPHFFDLIIVDESHRSIYNVYQNILNYFNAIVLGLTATPTDAIDHNTFDIFECEDGLPTFAYAYEDAVNNRPPFLSDFQVLKVSTKFQEKGIHQGSISLDDQKRLIAQGIEPEEINFEGSDLERKVSNAGTNTLIVREFMEECIKDSTGVLPGKSIFFCMTKKHARRIEDIFDKLYPEHAGVLARVIVSDDPRVYGREGLLEQFKKQDMPRVAISVDMLDTGIDIPELVNLAFAKPVFSYTKFWQMIGRGTRLLNPRKMKSWCLIKDNFLIIDYWDNFEYFKLNPKGKEVKSQVALPVKLFKFRVSKLQLAKEKNESALVEKTIRELKAMLELLPEKSVVVLEAKSDLVRTQEAGFWDILRPEHFQFLEKTIAPVLRAVSGVDFEATRFEKDVVEASVALLRTDQKELDRLAEVVCAQISELPLSIYLVEKEEELIRQALTPHFWATLTEEKLDSLIEKLAPLMRFRQSLLPPEEEAQLNLKDLLYHKSTVEFGPEREMVSISRYKELVEKTVRQMATSNLVMQKLKQGEDLTEQEIKILADELSQRDPYVTEPLLQKVYDNRKAKFIQFIRYILGLEELQTFTEVVTAIFDDFLHQHTDLSSKQIQFLEILKSFLIDKGKVAKKDLVSAPFTQLHPDGILGIFPAQTIEEIISLTEKIVA
jgi:type I restriction enzyme R subunit